MIYDFNLENTQLGKSCILHLDENCNPTLSRVIWNVNEPETFNTIILTPESPHFYYKGIECVILEEGSPLFKDLLTELMYIPTTACISIGEPDEKIEPLVSIWLDPSVSYDSSQVEAYLNAFSQPTKLPFSQITIFLSYFIETLYNGFIAVDSNDIKSIVENSKIGYLGIGVSSDNDIFQAIVDVKNFFNEHPPCKNSILSYAVNKCTDIALVEDSTEKINPIFDPNASIIFEATFHDNLNAAVFVLTT